MESANGKTGEKRLYFPPYCGDEPTTSYDRTYKKRPRTFFGLFFVHYKEIEGDNRPGMFFSVLQHTENELQRKNGEQTNGKQTALLGGRVVRAFLHRCDELFEAQDDGGVDDG